MTLSSVNPLKPAHLEPLDWTKKDVKTIDLRKTVNRAFADETAWDGKGGWTDQGPINLGTLPIGRQVFAGVPFDVIDPATNGGKSMVVISNRPEQKNVASEVILPFGHKAKILTFLHAGGLVPLFRKIGNGGISVSERY